MREDEIIARVADVVLQRLEPGNLDSLKQDFSVLTQHESHQDDASCFLCQGRGECHRRRPVTVRRILEAGACRVAARYPAGPVEDEMAPCIDHTLLRPEATYAQITRLCREAAEYHFASVCVNPVHVAPAQALLSGTGVAVCTVVGFPLGATTTDVKVFETQQAVRSGAREIDMVLHVGALKSRDFAAVENDVRSVAAACGEEALLKVIIEAALLSDEEKVQACAIAKLAAADFVKTSTGFGPGGATIADVELMRRTVGEDLGVKAAGGIRDRETAERMIRAGADRVGASASVKIMRERDAKRG
jgi:deoxyribose-phosphate aldolase